MGAAALAAISAGSYRAFIVEPFALRVSNIDIVIPNMPKQIDGLRILHLTDLHILSSGRRETRLIDLCRDIDCDLIVFTGDYVARRRGTVPPCVSVISRLLNGRKAYGVLGNNDYNPEVPRREMIKRFADIGLTILLNESVHLEHQGGKYILGGVEDPIWSLDDLETTFGTGAANREFKVLLSHSPHTFARASEMGIGLVLAGHTHGGQVCLPKIGTVYLNKRHISQYVAGHFVKGNTHMYVSRGVGTNRLPVRFFCPPEVVFVTLRSG